MEKSWIKNKNQLSQTKNREAVLDIIEAGFNAIDTESVINDSIVLTEKILKIKNQVFDLSKYNSIYIIGFGKASCLAAKTLENILGNHIKKGIAIGLSPVSCEYIQTYAGTHPHPTIQNVELSQKILELTKTLSEKDLIITVVSGGGSALLCWPLDECKQATRLYTDFLKTGGDITELNTIRKHISLLKGGGLAKQLYPARVVGLIFSDIPGDNFNLVASGPTYKDTTSIADVEKILQRYNLQDYKLNETPKENKYFENVTNIPLVSNLHVLEAMQNRAKTLGISCKILSSELYDSPEKITRALISESKKYSLVLGAGEPKLKVTKSGGTGGRCMRMGIEILPILEPNLTFAAVASDGLDNSDSAGVIVDSNSKKRLQELKLDLEDFKDRFDSYTFFNKLGNELLFTGPTHANISDFMLIYNK